MIAQVGVGERVNDGFASRGSDAAISFGYYQIDICDDGCEVRVGVVRRIEVCAIGAIIGDLDGIVDLRDTGRKRRQNGDGEIDSLGVADAQRPDGECTDRATGCLVVATPDGAAVRCIERGVRRYRLCDDDTGRRLVTGVGVGNDVVEGAAGRQSDAAVIFGDGEVGRCDHGVDVVCNVVVRVDIDSVVNSDSIGDGADPGWKRVIQRGNE